MFGIGIPELVVILIVALVVFGPNKLPEVGRAVGKGLREFRKASSALQTALNEPLEQEKPAQPKPPQEGTSALAETTETVVQPQTETAVPSYAPPTQESVRQQVEEQKAK